MNSDKETAPEREQSRSGRRQRSALIYLVILFAAAFLMLLLAYFMQQRSSAEIIGNLNNLQQSMGSIQSIDQLRVENQALREEIDGLKEQIAALEEENERVKGSSREFETALEDCTDALSNTGYLLGNSKMAMMFFWQINEAYVLEDYDLCRDLVEKLESYFGPYSDPTQYLLMGEDNTDRTAVERYQEILEALSVKTES